MIWLAVLAFAVAVLYAVLTAPGIDDEIRRVTSDDDDAQP